MTTLRRTLACRTISVLRLLALGAGLVLAVGGFAGVLHEPLLAAAIGPTLYVLLVHPDAEVSHIRNAVLGHGAAIGAGLVSLGLLGLWRTPAVLGSDGIPFRRTAAVALAVGLTVAILELTNAHHAPGLIIGLLAVIALAPTIAQLPLRDVTRRRHVTQAATDQGASA